MPEFLEVLLGDSTGVKVAYYGTLTGIGLLILFLIYRKVAPGPRRRRALRHARGLLAHADWQEALKQLEVVRRIGSPSARWRKRIDQLEAECLEMGQAAALLDKRFDEALDFAERIARIREHSPLEMRLKIQGVMLAELRRLFSIPGESRGVIELADRILQVHAPCREAHFWQGMGYLRGGQQGKAIEAFLIARGDESKKSPPMSDAAPSQPATQYLDPSLYLGAVMLRQGKGKESLRYLTEANRMDTNCPIVTILLGSGIVEAGGDTKFAVKALQRALGSKGLLIWADNPARAWVEAFPEGKSYVRKLSSELPFHCPLFGSDLKYLQLQGMRALGQGLYALGDYQEAANLFTKLIQEGAPSLPVVRGIGLSLARIGRYDEAFKHLRAAQEMEHPPERATAGFLALCGAKGTPKSDEDRLRNLRWAIQTVTPFTAPGDEEWISLASAIFAEARDANLSVGEDDQLYLCEHLLSIDATDPPGAQAFRHLFETFPQVVRPEYAWLFVRAAQLHRIEEPKTLEMFALAFADRAGLEAFFDARGWSVADVEFAYLARTARSHPGAFPTALGADYPPRGEAFLRARSVELEKTGDLDESLAVADILGKLVPGSAAAQDRVAGLFYRRGQIDEAMDALARWKDAHPQDPLPLARAALMMHRQGKNDNALTLLGEARHLADGPLRGKLSYLAAQLTLRKPVTEAEGERFSPERLRNVRELLEQCLADAPDHPQALGNLAAVRWLLGDEAGLATLGPALDQPESDDPHVLYFGALARLVQKEFERVVSLCGALRSKFSPVAERAAPAEVTERNGSPSGALHIEWAVEAAYLQGLAEQALGRGEDALVSLAVAAGATDSPSASHAQAVLGQVSFTQGKFGEASRWWQNLDARHRTAWKIGEALGGTVFLTALEAMEQGRFEEAAEKLRAAGKQGCRDRRLGQLLILALFRAGQKAVYG